MRHPPGMAMRHCIGKLGLKSLRDLEGHALLLRFHEAEQCGLPCALHGDEKVVWPMQGAVNPDDIFMLEPLHEFHLLPQADDVVHLDERRLLYLLNGLNVSGLCVAGSEDRAERAVAEHGVVSAAADHRADLRPRLDVAPQWRKTVEGLMHGLPKQAFIWLRLLLPFLALPELANLLTCCPEFLFQVQHSLPFLQNIFHSHGDLQPGLTFPADLTQYLLSAVGEKSVLCTKQFREIRWHLCCA
mmetsp:Transcript_130487/g.325513  ORF Transcript_130487/g.325513 Transcript_130487/m.325513 type:complete len:243 (+) Transcript_130487:558-1286(+)